jgi:hypothetical protein
MAKEPGARRDGSVPSPPAWLRIATAALLAASIALAGVGLLIPIGTFNVDTNVGPVGFTLESEFTQSSINYSGSAPSFGIEVGDDVAFLGGTGDFQEKVGFLKGSAKERTNTIKPWTDPQQRYATLNVTVRAETIPWWVVDVEVPCQVEVELVDWANVSELTVDRAYLEFRVQKGGAALSRPAWEQKASDRLERIGQRLVYRTDVAVPDDWGEFELFGMVNVTMMDTSGTTATHVLRSYSTEPKTIRLWSIPTGQGVKVALAAASMPVTLLGILLGAVALVTAWYGARWRLPLAIAAVVALVLGAVFIHVGISELATVVGFPDDVAFSGGLWVVAAAFAPAAAAAGLLGWASMRWPEPDEAGEGAGAKGAKGAKGADGGQGRGRAKGDAEGARDGDASKETRKEESI